MINIGSGVRISSQENTRVEHLIYDIQSDRKEERTQLTLLTQTFFLSARYNVHIKSGCIDVLYPHFATSSWARFFKSGDRSSQQRAIQKYFIKIITTAAKDPVPRSPQIWLERVRKPVSETNPKLTLLLDLDKTLFHNVQELGRMNELFDWDGTGEALYIDVNALRQVAEVQNLGHNIVVVTRGKYKFTLIYRLFLEHNILLAQDDYHNRNRINKDGIISKRTYINRCNWNRKALLIDDLAENKPMNTHFIQANNTDSLPLIPSFLPPITNQPQRLKKLYPENILTWFTQASATILPQQPRLKLIITTRDILFFNEKPENIYTLKYLHKDEPENPLYINTNLLRELSSFLSRGFELVLFNNCEFISPCLRTVFKPFFILYRHYLIAGENKPLKEAEFQDWLEKQDSSTETLAIHSQPTVANKNVLSSTYEALKDKLSFGSYWKIEHTPPQQQNQTQSVTFLKSNGLEQSSKIKRKLEPN
ncbi:hypothetical protein [Parashewanella spongiae]|uniref:hypothetical protein n=1 Tax=Parashewanella spongiae TaxID=342950 RepID=UPI0010595B9D|nr:hypothetical protein [Parashewanella spongiae]